MICTPGHCFWTCQRPDIRQAQAAPVVAEASRSKRFHWFWLSGRLMSNQCSPILTRRQRLTKRHSCAKKAFCCAVFLCCSGRTVDYYLPHCYSIHYSMVLCSSNGTDNNRLYAHAATKLAWYYKTTCVLLSVCLSALLRSQVLLDFDWNLAQKLEAQKLRRLSFGGQNPITPSPIFPQFFTPTMHFQWEGPNTAVTRPVNRLWRLSAQTTCLGSGYKHKVAKCCNPQFCP